jgi:DNA-directed RNA polymerase I subunit RPA1
MFRLLQVGLIHEAHMIESFSVSDLGEQLKSLRLSDVPTVEEDEAEEEGNNNLHDGTMRARETYVRQVLREHRLKVNIGDIRKGKHEGAAEMRRGLVKEFLAQMVKEKRCRSCDGISPVYRKDRWVKIFERDLSEKETAAMAQAGRKRTDALALSRKAQKHRGQTPDEGIADVDSSSEASSGERDSEGEGEELDENGDVVMTDAPAKAKKGKPKAPRPAQRYLSTMEVHKRLEMLFEQEQELLSLLYNSKPRPRSSKPLSADMFFISTLLVPPNRYRPEARMGDSQISEAQQNSLYKMILRSASMVAQISREISGQNKEAADEGRRTRDMSSLYQAWTELQDAVNSLMDRDKNPVQGAAAKRNEEGIKQKLEKKEGLFRKNMMGKRVNFAARSVISPDPNIETNEIGVPPVFARKLTYPEPVTSHNFKDLQ